LPRSIPLAGSARVEAGSRFGSGQLPLPCAPPQPRSARAPRTTASCHGRATIRRIVRGRA